MWWQDGVLYQIYPRSFADTDGDGIGDLRGILARLDHLQWLGVDGIWLNPTMPSPNHDWGYDVADYTSVHPDLGTLEDLDALVAGARERGMHVLLDLVPNHTSDQHPWFVDALSGRDARHRDYYVWADPAPGGGPPNNWESNFGGSAWQFHEPTGQYFLNNFLPSQPDLNWWNDEVREAFDDILRFWYDRGISGFRIDVCHAIVKDRELRDDPAVTPDDHPEVRKRALKQVFSMNRPEVHDVLRRWRGVSDAFDPRRILIGETYVLDLDSLVPYYGNGEDELNLAFNFLFVHSDLDAADMRTIVEGIEAKLPAGAWPVYTGSNHDAGRLATRWAGDDPRRARAALLILLTLRGTPFLYYGDELGLPEVPTDFETALDPVARRTGDPSRNRDRARTPMPWTDEPGGGFTGDGVTPWLPFGETRSVNVAAQREDPSSTLNLVRDLIALRKSSRDLVDGDYETLDAPEGAWAWRRGDGFAVAVNLSDADVTVGGIGGRVAIGTDRRRDGEAVGDALRLGPYEAVVVEREIVSRVPELDPLLSTEGWAYASLPPQEPGDPGRFHALFGRDSLITALQVLPAAPEVARATLRALAGLQGRVDDPEIDEEPGKIPHEYRPVAGEWFAEHGWPVRDGALRYYGTADATSWYLVVLGALGDAALTAELDASWRAAAGWLTGALDAGGGLIRYGPRRGPGGLAQQGWRDAIAPVEHHPEGAGIVRADGTEPAAPLADADCQAAAVAALDALARLDPVGDWAARAAALRSLLARWSPDVMAIEGDGTVVPGAGSQLGWLLWAGALEGETAAAAADRLAQPDVLTGFGVRTLASEHPAFRAHAYHRGGVWPFDSWLGWGGLRAAGRFDAAERVRAGVLDALDRLGLAPELYAVTAAGALQPISVSNRVQAWTVGARWALEHHWDGRAQ